MSMSWGGRGEIIEFVLGGGRVKYALGGFLSLSRGGGRGHVLGGIIELVPGEGMEVLNEHVLGGGLLSMSRGGGGGKLLILSWGGRGVK